MLRARAVGEEGGPYSQPRRLKSSSRHHRVLVDEGGEVRCSGWVGQNECVACDLEVRSTASGAGESGCVVGGTVL